MSLTECPDLGQTASEFESLDACHNRSLTPCDTALRVFVLFHIKSLCLASLWLFLALSLSACGGDRPPNDQIMIKNDSQDSSYNVITVSGGGKFASLKPGEKLILPAGTKNFSVERRYKDYTRSYSVTCPPIKGRGILVKLIDIHVNRIAGGCETTNASKE